MKFRWWRRRKERELIKEIKHQALRAHYYDQVMRGVYHWNTISDLDGLAMSRFTPKQGQDLFS